MKNREWYLSLSAEELNVLNNCECCIYYNDEHNCIPPSSCLKGELLWGEQERDDTYDPDWVPEYEEKYWIVKGSGDVDWVKCKNDDYDKGCKNSLYGICKTEEAMTKRKAYVEECFRRGEQLKEHFRKIPLIFDSGE